jgi:hypothetical protein
MAAVAKAFGSAAALALALLCVRSARADTSDSFRFSWVRGDGAGSCPDTRALAVRVEQRLGRNPFSDSAEQSIEGSVVQRQGLYRAELRVRDSAGVSRGTRELSAGGPDCSELAEAVVLAVVLAIDPNAALGGSPVPPAVAPVAPPPAAPPVVDPPALAPCPAPRCPPSPPCPRATCPMPPALATGGLIGRAVLAAGILPGIVPGAAVFGEMGNERVRASLGFVYFPESATDGGSYAFGLTAGSAGASFAWPLADGLELSALGELELGALHAVVYELPPVEPGDQLWFAAAAGPRLGFFALSPLRLELGASLVVPFVRPAFEVRGVAEPVFQSAPVGGFFYLGAGLGTP